MIKKRVLELVRGLSSWSYRMSEQGPQRTRGGFLEVMLQANRFLEKFEENIDFLADSERVTKDQACRMMRDILFQGHKVYDYDEPSRGRILNLCLHLGVKAPAGWHGHFLLASKRYRSLHRPNNRLKCPDYIREIREKNR